MHADQRIEVLVEKPCGGSVRLMNYAFWAGASMRCDERHRFRKGVWVSG
jgi:hypothetical protein